MSSLSATWRLARREVTSHRWRSVLVVVLIALPVMLAAALGTVLETNDVSPSESLQPELGRGQAIVTWDGAPLRQNAAGDVHSTTGDGIDIGRRDIVRRAEELAHGPLLPVVRASTSLVAERRAWRVDTLSTDYSDSLTTGMVDLNRGKLPTGPDEVIVSPRLVASGLDVGQTVAIGGSRVKIVGVGNIGLVSSGSRAVAFSLTAPVKTDLSDWTPEDRYEVEPLRFIVGGSNPVGADDVRLWNRAGFSVLSRHVVEHPDQGGAAFEEFESSSEMRQLIAIVVVALVIEVVLLAGPAFAVGARRQRHELALVSVAGGSPRDVRRIVLLQAAILGMVAAGLGAMAGIPAAWLGMSVAERFGESSGPFDISWLAVVLAIILAVASATAAASLPARHAARADVVTTLAGRQPEPAVRPGWPLLGAVLLTVGVLGSISAASAVSDFANAWWAVISVLGAVLMTPWLISRVAKAARLLPLPARLALRDADRHRGRTAPAIAAVMASVSAVTALGIASSSDAAETDDVDGRVYYPSGTVLLTSDRMDRVVPAIKRDTGVTFTPLPTVEDASVMVPLDAQSSEGLEVAVADTATLRRWGIDLTGDEREALESGLLLVHNGVRMAGGRAAIEAYDDNDPAGNPVKRRLKAAPADLTIEPADGLVAGAVISPRSAKQLGLTVVTKSAIADRTARDMDVNAVEVAAATADPVSWYINVEKTQRSEYFWVYLILAVAGSLAVLIGTFSATGLALSDARPDLATLGAVGARPLTRRLVAGSHALILATLGAALGVIVGLTPGIASAHLLTTQSPGGFTLDIPWALLALLLVGLPLLAALVTTIVARLPSPRPIREAL
ncbi:MAG: FtsX-like permease family protein [Aeromicrobium sp.]